MLVSGPAESAQEPRGKIPDEYKKPAAIEKNASQNQRQAGTPTAFEKSLIESLRTIADQQKADYEQRRADQKPWWIDPGLLGVGFVYTVFAGFQWWAIRRQAKSTREALIISERAWVGVGFDQLYTLGNDFVDLRIYNSGKSPGHIKDVRLVGFEVADKDKPVPYKPKSAPPPGMGRAWIIFPGESTTQRWDVRLEPEEITEVAKKAKRLTLFGFVCYDDIFGNGHVTNFYRVFMEVDEPLRGRFMIPPDAEPGQNEAT